VISSVGSVEGYIIFHSVDWCCCNNEDQTMGFCYLVCYFNTPLTMEQLIRIPEKKTFKRRTNPKVSGVDVFPCVVF